MSRVTKLRDAVARQLVRGAGRLAVEYKPWDDFYYSSEAVSGVNGGPVTSTTAMRLSAIHACIRIVSTTIGALPWFAYERLGDGSRTRATGLPAHLLLHETPNSYQTPFEFKQEIGAHIAGRGNAYVEKIYGDVPGGVAELWPIGPDHVRAEWYDRRSGRRRVYDVASSYDGRARVISSDGVWHPRLLSLDGGLTGASPIQLASQGISVGLTAQRFAERILRNNGRPSGLLKSDMALDDKQSEQIRRRWRETQGGENQGDIAVLGKGAMFHAISITPDDAKLAELLDWGIADAARTWGVPLVLLQHEKKDTSWGEGMRQVGRWFNQFTLAGYIVPLEEGADMHLIDDRTRFFTEIQVDALLRGDMEGRFEAYQLAVNANNPWMTRNEIRKLENLSPDTGPDGDRFLPAANNVGPGTTARPKNGSNGTTRAAPLADPAPEEVDGHA